MLIFIFAGDRFPMKGKSSRRSLRARGKALSVSLLTGVDIKLIMGGLTGPSCISILSSVEKYWMGVVGGLTLCNIKINEKTFGCLCLLSCANTSCVEPSDIIAVLVAAVIVPVASLSTEAGVACMV